MDPRPIRFYALCEPDADHIRYVGQTAYSLNARLRRHMWREHTAKSRWIRALRAQGRRPRVVLLEVRTSGHREACRREAAWMRACVDAGHDLLNDALARPGRQDPEVSDLFAAMAGDLPFATPEQMADGDAFYPQELGPRRPPSRSGPHITRSEIDAKRTPRSGRVRKRQLLAWGVPYPPPSGWEEQLVKHGIPYRTDTD